MQSTSTTGTRCHVVLVPGFGGFDALGRVEYYSGVTDLFQELRAENAPLLAAPLVLHYFDNLPTAAVATRAGRLLRYLAKRMARGEILDTDRVVLVGHSTGGLDIRKLIWDLHETINASQRVHVDSGYGVDAQAIRNCIQGVVFLSVPHWGTNIADWVYSHRLLRQTAISDLRAAFQGSQVELLDKIEAVFVNRAAAFMHADLLLALRDALTEANGRLCGSCPSCIADAQEAASELELYLRHMSTDFHVINDLTSEPHGDDESPAHFDDEKRNEERKLWGQPHVQTLSYATVGGRAFTFPSGCRAPTLELTDLSAYPEIAVGHGLSAGTDISYRFCYLACAGGPFCCRTPGGKITRVLQPPPPAPPPPDPIELWDNDGIVNTISMLWPSDAIVLVEADHLDIVGHYRLRLAAPADGGSRAPRTYQSYDSLRSVPQFTPEMFTKVWTDIFLFASGIAKQSQAGRAKRVKVAAARASG